MCWAAEGRQDVPMSGKQDEPLRNIVHGIMAEWSGMDWAWEVGVNWPGSFTFQNDSLDTPRRVLAPPHSNIPCQGFPGSRPFPCYPWLTFVCVWRRGVGRMWVGGVKLTPVFATKSAKLQGAMNFPHHRAAIFPHCLRVRLKERVDGALIHSQKSPRAPCRLSKMQPQGNPKATPRRPQGDPMRVPALSMQKSKQSAPRAPGAAQSTQSHVSCGSWRLIISITASL